MSWVFLTETHAWKLKKPVRYDYLDFSTPDARRIDCELEVSLNRRLAPGVYLGVVPLSCHSSGLNLQGRGTPIDWLVQMRRLPAERMLDTAIAEHTWKDEDLQKVGRLLGRFYKGSAPVEDNESEYRSRLAEDLHRTKVELERPEYGLPAGLPASVVSDALRVVEERPELFDARVRAGRIVDAHGDLRPEHICLLEPQPVIIDCLEFNRSLRILDSASELSFLRLECERLGGTDASTAILKACESETGECPPQELLRFYRIYHACMRAKLAVWHIDDAAREDVPDWIGRASAYLHLVAG
jgi:aminoglycoside phosphotransferase family enzyme